MPCCFSFQSQSGSPWSAFPVLFCMITLICKMFSFCFSFLLVWGENLFSFQFLFTRPHFHLCYFSVISHQVYHIVLWDTVSGTARSIWSMLCPLYMQRHYDAFCAVSTFSSMLLQHLNAVRFFWGRPWSFRVLSAMVPTFPCWTEPLYRFDCKINFIFIFWCILLHVYQRFLQLT